MLEKTYKYSITNQKLIEKIVDDENIIFSHAVLEASQALPTHFSDSNVYLSIIRGELTIELNDQAPNVYPVGSIVNVPFNTKMTLTNKGSEPLEFFAVKSPNPRDMKK